MNGSLCKYNNLFIFFFGCFLKRKKSFHFDFTIRYRFLSGSLSHLLSLFPHELVFCALFNRSCRSGMHSSCFRLNSARCFEAVASVGRTHCWKWLLCLWTTHTGSQGGAWMGINGLLRGHFWAVEHEEGGVFLLPFFLAIRGYSGAPEGARAFCVPSVRTGVLQVALSGSGWVQLGSVRAQTSNSFPCNPESED